MLVHVAAPRPGCIKRTRMIVQMHIWVYKCLVLIELIVVLLYYNMSFITTTTAATNSYFATC